MRERSSSHSFCSINGKFLTGFTLLETLVAIAVLLAALIGPVALIGHALSSASFSKNNVIAHNLAQEGMELFRAIRENNILCASLGGTMEWNDDPDLGGGPPKLRDYYEIDVLNTITLSCGSDSINTPRPTNRNGPNCVTDPTSLLLDPDGVYNYTSGSPTIFSRCMEVCSPPSVPPCSVAADLDIPLIPADHQMEIISTVSWQEKGALKSIILRDRLYYWQ